MARRLMCGDPVSHHSCEPLHFDARRRVHTRANIDGVEVAEGLRFYRIKDRLPWVWPQSRVERALLGRGIIHPRIRIAVQRGTSNATPGSEFIVLLRCHPGKVQTPFEQIVSNFLAVKQVVSSWLRSSDSLLT